MREEMRFDLSAEIQNIQKEYGIERDDVILVLQNATEKIIHRRVLVSFENNANDSLSLLRINNDGSVGEVTYKAFKKGRKTLQKEFEALSQKYKTERINAIFKKGEIVEGLILDITHNGCFVTAKGEKAFFPFLNGYSKEQNIGLYTRNTKLEFKVVFTHDGKVILSRKSVEILRSTIARVIGRHVKIKPTKGEEVLVYVGKPYLNETQLAILHATLPMKVIFKKDKE